MKKFLILQIRPEDEVADSELQAILTKGQIRPFEYDRIRVEQLKIKEVDLAPYCAIIVGGSPFDISTPSTQKSAPQKQIERFFFHLFDQIIPKDFPFLGACSGNGLLGHYCGVEISSRYAEPIGPVELSITEEGIKDDLLIGFPQKIVALVGHKEACDQLPPEATLLATSSPCPIQMFRIKQNIYATQFHPEADEREFNLRIDFYKNFGYFPPEQADRVREGLRGVQIPESNEILKRFVDKYRA